MLPHCIRVDLGVMVTNGYSSYTQISKARASPSDCLVSYKGHSLGVGFTPCSDAVLQPQPTWPNISVYRLLIFDENT